jgi:hypothetical protein
MWEGTVSLFTTGNVTYVVYAWVLEGYKCEEVVNTGPVIRNGSNFWSPCLARSLLLPRANSRYNDCSRFRVVSLGK